MLVIAGHTELGAEVVSAIPASVQRCFDVWEGKKKKAFTAFPKDALDLGFF